MLSPFRFIDPPSKAVILQAAKDARASHGAVIVLFKRIESFFKRLEIYAQISLTTKMAEVLVKIVIELLSILSIATKEVGRRRASKLSQQELLHASSLMFFQSYLLGSSWGGRMLRTRSKGSRA